MNNQLPMFVPGANKMKIAVPDDTVGLSSHKLDESEITNTLFNYVASDKPSDKQQRGRFGPRASGQIKAVKKMKQAPVPEGTVGKHHKMREAILQMSLAPTIYRKKHMVHHPGNVDFGNDDDY